MMNGTKQLVILGIGMFLGSIPASYSAPLPEETSSEPSLTQGNVFISIRNREEERRKEIATSAAEDSTLAPSSHPQPNHRERSLEEGPAVPAWTPFGGGFYPLAAGPILPLGLGYPYFPATPYPCLPPLMLPPYQPLTPATPFPAHAPFIPFIQGPLPHGGHPLGTATPFSSFPPPPAPLSDPLPFLPRPTAVEVPAPRETPIKKSDHTLQVRDGEKEPRPAKAEGPLKKRRKKPTRAYNPEEYHQAKARKADKLQRYEDLCHNPPSHEVEEMIRKVAIYTGKIDALYRMAKTTDTSMTKNAWSQRAKRARDGLKIKLLKAYETKTLAILLATLDQQYGL